MNDTDVKDKYEQIINHTLNKNLKGAFDILNELLSSVHKSEWNDKKNELEQNYKYLLQYVFDGIKDPAQEEIYNNIRISLLNLADLAYNAIKTSSSNEYPYVQKRGISKLVFPINSEIEKILSTGGQDTINDLLKDVNISSSSEIEVVGEEKKDEILDLTFMRLWLKAVYSNRETSLLESLILSEEVRNDDKCLLVSALMLSLLLQFDEKKFEILLTILQATNGEVQTRAMVAFILCCNRYALRLTLYEGLQKGIQNIIRKPWFASKFTTCALFFINGLETEKVNEEVQKTIIPDLMKSSASISENLDLSKLNLENIEENPEWKSLNEKNDITDKIERFTELQRNGADVFLSTFSSLKNHSFFSHICNWFRPFNTTNSWVRREFKGKDYKLFDLISLNPMICNSDRYSMLFSLSSVPESYLKNIEDSLKIQEEQIKQIQKENKLSEDTNKERLETQLYWQDLYRFFKLHPFKQAFPDPYKKGLDINSLPFKDILGDKVLSAIADTYFKKKFYTEALSIYLLISNKDVNSNILQRIGYCYQKKAFYDRALTYYNKADLIDTNNPWLNKMKALCHMQQMQYEEALTIYNHLVEKDRDSSNIALYMAQCYIGMQQYDKALPLLYKLEYLSPSNKIYRTIAWCAFLDGKFEHSEKYLMKIGQSERTSKDYMNLGHISLCQNNRVKALDFYTLARSTKKDDQTIESKFLNDLTIFEKYITDKEDIPFIVDRLRYIE